MTTAISGAVDTVCDDSNTEIWLGQPHADTYEECVQLCKDNKDCKSISYYSHGGCSQWKTMCRYTIYREDVISKNIKGSSMNKLECDASNGEKWISKFQAGTLKACEEACMNDPTEKCNSFTYYNHGSCSFFSTCCEKTRVVDNAHSERWRLPPL